MDQNRKLKLVHVVSQLTAEPEDVTWFTQLNGKPQSTLFT